MPDRTDIVYRYDGTLAGFLCCVFESYEKSTQNAIRKAYNAIPQILVEYQDSQLGTTSGEALRQAASFYNSMTVENRMKITQIFDELFKNFIDPALRGRNWEIRELDFTPKTAPPVQP